MKKTPGSRPSRRSPGGFTLMEVMIAIGILAISLTAIFSVQASSIQTAGRLKHYTVATLLAQSKMVDIEQELMREGFSDFAEEMNGDFSEEGWPEISWRASITKVRIPVPPAMPSGDGEGTNAYASMMSGYASMITDMIANALRECIVTVEWYEGRERQELSLATHFIEVGRASMLQAPIGGAGALGSGEAAGVGGSSPTATPGGMGEQNPFTKVPQQRSIGTGVDLKK